MAAYATAERAAHPDEPRLALPGPSRLKPEQQPDCDALLSQLADLVAERVAARLARPTAMADDWLDTREAAEYLGVHRDTVRRLAAERAVPSEQEGPGCKLFFRRSDLDAWRCGSRASLRLVPGLRS